MIRTELYDSDVRVCKANFTGAREGKAVDDYENVYCATFRVR